MTENVLGPTFPTHVGDRDDKRDVRQRNYIGSLDHGWTVHGRPYRVYGKWPRGLDRPKYARGHEYERRRRRVGLHCSADAAQLQAELRRHGAEPGRRVRVALVDDQPRRKRKGVRGVLAGKLPDDFLTDEDFEAQHRANIEAAERRFGSLDR